MTKLPRITEVQHLGARRLRVRFSDGLVRELDFANALPGVLQRIDDDKVFATVAVDEIAGTLTWPVGIDLDPDVLHGDHRPASQPSPQVIREFHLAEAG